MSKTSRDKRDGKNIKSSASNDHSEGDDNLIDASGKGRDAIDAIVRARYIEYLANSGIAQGRLHLEALFWMPLSFVRMYERLYERAFKETVVGGQAGAKEKGELGKRGIAADMKGRRVGAGAGGVGKRYKEYWVIRDENAMRVKGLVDKKLERMVLEMNGELNMERNGGIRCGGGCGRFLKEDWKYCPYDGARKSE